MPNPDIILEAQFPIHHNATTVIQLLTYESSTLEAVGPTSARLPLPTSLTYLNCHSPPTVMSQHAFWHRRLVCPRHACSEFEMRTQIKTATPCRHAEQRRKCQWQNAGQWQDDLDFSTELRAHLLADTRGSICLVPCDLVWLTSRTLSDISPRVCQCSVVISVVWRTSFNPGSEQQHRPILRPPVYLGQAGQPPQVCWPC